MDRLKCHYVGEDRCWQAELGPFAGRGATPLVAIADCLLFAIGMHLSPRGRYAGVS